MKYLIWRHENSIGNSAEQTVGLAKQLWHYPDIDVTIYVEHEFQKYFALCIPGVFLKNIKMLDGNKCNLADYKSILSVKEYANCIVPSVYADGQDFYFGHWSMLGDSESKLTFPFRGYPNKHDLPANAIVMQLREKGTHWKRVDGAESEPARFVNPQTFFDVALHYANRGFKVVRIGDKNQTPMPEHHNIIDFAKYENKTILDDLWVINMSKVFLSSDSGIWPMAGGLKKNMVLSNVVGHHYTSWLPPATTTVLFKQNGVDNSFEQLIDAVNAYL